MKIVFWRNLLIDKTAKKRSLIYTLSLILFLGFGKGKPHGKKTQHSYSDTTRICTVLKRED